MSAVDGNQSTLGRHNAAMDALVHDHDVATSSEAVIAALKAGSVESALAAPDDATSEVIIKVFASDNSETTTARTEATVFDDSFSSSDSAALVVDNDGALAAKITVTNAHDAATEASVATLDDIMTSIDRNTSSSSETKSNTVSDTRTPEKETV